jgi:hypothetical protein
MSTIEIKAYESLKHKLGEKEAEYIIDFINSKAESLKNEAKERFVTDEKVRMYISDAKNELLKWFIGLFITLALMMLGLYATILLK